MSETFGYSLLEYQTLLLARAEDDLKLAHAREDLKARQLFLTPTGADFKALGANDTDRENVMLKTFATDQVCVELRAKILALEMRQAETAGAIAQIEAARRAQEWDITRLLATALAEYVGHGNPGQMAAQASGVKAATSAAEEITESLYTIDDIPF